MICNIKLISVEKNGSKANETNTHTQPRYDQMVQQMVDTTILWFVAMRHEATKSNAK